jgi:hypothetical protein
LTDRVLLCIFAVYALTIGGPYIEIYNRNYDFPYPHLINNAWLFLLLHGPLLWLYVKSLTVKNFKVKHFHLLHLFKYESQCFFRGVVSILLLVKLANAYAQDYEKIIFASYQSTQLNLFGNDLIIASI